MLCSYQASVNDAVNNYKVGKHMKMKMIIPGVMSFLLITGCALNFPKTAEEFRQAIPTAFKGMADSYTVNQPFNKVARNFKTQGAKCLDVRVEYESRTNMSYQYLVTKYTPTVIVSANKAELHVQQLHETGVLYPSEIPDNGPYLMVFDATPVSKNKTKIDYYGPDSGFDHIVKAVNGWASGTNMGCPDLTQ